MSIDFSRLFPGRDLKAEWKERMGTNEFGAPVRLLPGIRVDIDQLRDFYEKAKVREHSVFEDEVIQYAFGERYCSPKDYWPFIVHHPSDLSVTLQKALDEERGEPWHEHQKNLSSRKRMKSLRELNEDYDPIIDERNYNKFPERLRGSYIDKLLSQFKSPPIRARFVSLAPGEEIEPHIDYNPKYALKVHIPVYTHEGAVLGFEEHGEKHLVCGYAYAINTGIKHWAKNTSRKMRIHLIVSLDGQEDLSDA